MSERYFITGAQLGMIKSMITLPTKDMKLLDKSLKDVDDLIQKIIDEQFFGNAKEGDKIMLVRPSGTKGIQQMGLIEAYLPHEKGKKG